MLQMNDSIWTGSYNIPAMDAGLDYESARDATPQWYGVSSGNGNDGVSHHYPDYFVRTADPYYAARLACISSMIDRWQEWADDALEVDGEAEYTISACIYNPPDDESEDDDSDWCSANGAWNLVDVFPVTQDDMDNRNAPEYETLEEAFSSLMQRFPNT